MSNTARSIMAPQDDSEVPRNGADSGKVGSDAAEKGQRLSTAKIVLLTVIMTLTSFTSLAASLAVTLLVPSIARTLGISTLQGQWVRRRLDPR